MKSNRPWFRSSGYRHLDVPIGEVFAERTARPDFVAADSWLPLIKYIKRTKRYKPKNGKTLFKERPIMYASHRDACIFKRYALRLSELFRQALHVTNDLDGAVIAGRNLGKGNYSFYSRCVPICKKDNPLRCAMFSTSRDSSTIWITGY